MVRDPALLVTFVGADQVVSEQGKTTEAANANRGRVRMLVAHWIYCEKKRNGQLGLSQSNTDIGYRSDTSQKMATSKIS